MNPRVGTAETAEAPEGTRALSPRLGGAVDWGLAATIGTRLCPSPPRMSRYTADGVVRDLTEASVAVEMPVREVTGLADGLPVPAARVLSRPEWVREAAGSMGHLISGGTATAPTGLLAGKPAGVQGGLMLAYLSSAILGQYDPFSGPDGTLLLVAPNIVAVERALRLNPKDFRTWVCAHEVTHRVQFSSSPWLADHMMANVAALGDGVDEPLSAVLSRLTTAVRDRRSPDASGGGIVSILRATQAEPQRRALDNLLVLGTLLEGHADHVMDAVGPAVVPTVADIRAAFDQRRARRASPLQRIVKALLGMDAKLAQYVRGKAFVDAVVGTVGMAQFNAVWTDADTLPRPEEIAEPERWIARVLG